MLGAPNEGRLQSESTQTTQLTGNSIEERESPDWSPFSIENKNAGNSNTEPFTVSLVAAACIVG